MNYDDPVPTSVDLKLPIAFQRAEGAVLLGGAVALYGVFEYRWWLFFVLLLAADVSMLGYLAGPRVGAVVYNLGHTLVLPSVLVLAWLSDVVWEYDRTTLTTWALPIALIWVAHIGLDRLLGYGLKLPTGFTHTHLGEIGPRRRSERIAGDAG